MGCRSSTVKPAAESAKTPIDNGEAESHKGVLKGDLTQTIFARQQREEKIKQRQMKVANAAEEMSLKIMEEKERLSLTSKSRATSLATNSRSGSPSVHRRHVHFLVTEGKAPSL